MDKERLLRTMGLTMFVFGLIGAIFFFVQIQVFQSNYVVAHGEGGNLTISPLGVSSAQNISANFYHLNPIPIFGCSGWGTLFSGNCQNWEFSDYAMEGLVIVSVIGFILWQYYQGTQIYRPSSLDKQKLKYSMAFAAFVVSSIGLAFMILDIQVANGIYKFGNTVFTAIGYPWWGEQVTGQTCWVGRTVSGTCGFLNYGQLFDIAFIVALLSLIIWRYYSVKQPSVPTVW